MSRAMCSRALGAALTVASTFGIDAVANAEVLRQSFMVPVGDGIELFVREVHDPDAGRAGLPLILVHGARVPGIASFDLPVENASLAGDLAIAGHRVFIVDLRGYGRSTRPPEMNAPSTGKPIVNSHEVMRDLDAVVQWTRRRATARQVAMFGWATGGHWAGMYASLHPEDVSHLVLLNALYGGTDGHETLGRGSPSEHPNRPGYYRDDLGAYRLNTAASLVTAWNNSIPLEDKAKWRDPRVVAAYQREALASDPTSKTRDPPAFRAPTGALEDSFYLATGRQLWDAASITARVLIVRSENDFWSRPEDVTKLLAHLANAAEARAVTLPGATHHVHLDRPDRGRNLLLAEVKKHLAYR